MAADAPQIAIIPTHALEYEAMPLTRRKTDIVISPD
jgi:hypothetical protein